MRWCNIAEMFDILYFSSCCWAECDNKSCWYSIRYIFLLPITGCWCLAGQIQQKLLRSVSVNSNISEREIVWIFCTRCQRHIKSELLFSLSFHFCINSAVFSMFTVIRATRITMQRVCSQWEESMNNKRNLSEVGGVYTQWEGSAWEKPMHRGINMHWEESIQIGMSLSGRSLPAVGGA